LYRARNERNVPGERRCARIEHIGGQVAAVDDRTGVETRAAHFDDLLPGETLELSEGLDVQSLQQSPGARCRPGLGSTAYGDTALGSRPVEEAFGCGHAHQGGDLRPTPGLTEYQHSIRVAPELADVLPHPLQGGNDIEHAHVARVGVVGAEGLAQIEEAEVVEPMGDADQYHILLACEVHAVIARRVTGPGGEPSTVEPHHDRTLAGGLPHR